MKRAFWVIGLIALAVATTARAQTQVGNYGLRFQSNSPVGQSCSFNAPVIVLQPLGDLFSCQNGVYALAGGGGAGMVYPPVGIGVSTGSAWGASIDPTTLATWPAVMLCTGVPCSFSYLPAFNNSPTNPGWSSPTTTLNAGLWLQSPWPSGVALVAAQGPIGGTQVASIYSTGINPPNVALLSPAGLQIFSLAPTSTVAPSFPGTTLGAPNDLNSALWCGQFYLQGTPSWPANMPPNVVANNGAVGVPMIVSCVHDTAPSPTTTASQLVFDVNANIMWLRSFFGGAGWSQWQQVMTSGTFTVATLPTCSASIKGATNAVTDATAPTYLGVLTGGGTVYAPVVCNGTAWVSY